MVLEPEQVDSRDEEIFRLQQLLFAAEDQIERLEKATAKPKKYRMSKKESDAWDSFLGCFDIIQADEYNLFHVYEEAGLLCKGEDGIWKRSTLQEEIHKMWSLGMDLHDTSIYGNDPRISDSFCNFEASIHRVRALYKEIERIDETHYKYAVRLVDKAIDQFEKLKHWLP